MLPNFLAPPVTQMLALREAPSLPPHLCPGRGATTSSQRRDSAERKDVLSANESSTPTMHPNASRLSGYTQTVFVTVCLYVVHLREILAAPAADSVGGFGSSERCRKVLQINFSQLVPSGRTFRSLDAVTKEPGSWQSRINTLIYAAIPNGEKICILAFTDMSPFALIEQLSVHSSVVQHVRILRREYCIRGSLQWEFRKWDGITAARV